MTCTPECRELLQVVAEDELASRGSESHEHQSESNAGPADTQHLEYHAHPTLGCTIRVV
ncbi:MAG: hypothetical protein ACI89X_003735 [Planctomycetota bacterium]|jgi:hypothetical protein